MVARRARPRPTLQYIVWVSTARWGWYQRALPGIVEYSFLIIPGRFLAGIDTDVGWRLATLQSNTSSRAGVLVGFKNRADSRKRCFR